MGLCKTSNVSISTFNNASDLKFCTRFYSSCVYRMVRFKGLNEKICKMMSHFRTLLDILLHVLILNVIPCFIVVYLGMWGFGIHGFLNRSRNWRRCQIVLHWRSTIRPKWSQGRVPKVVLQIYWETTRQAGGRNKREGGREGGLFICWNFDQ